MFVIRFGRTPIIGKQQTDVDRVLHVKFQLSHLFSFYRFNYDRIVFPSGAFLRFLKDK